MFLSDRRPVGLMRLGKLPVLRWFDGPSKADNEGRCCASQDVMLVVVFLPDYVISSLRADGCSNFAILCEKKPPIREVIY